MDLPGSFSAGRREPGTGGRDREGASMHPGRNGFRFLLCRAPSGLLARLLAGGRASSGDAAVEITDMVLRLVIPIRAGYLP